MAIKGVFTLTKKNADETGNIQGTKYRIWNNSGYDKTFTTDENGVIKVEELKLGKYNYQEVQAVDGYIIDNIWMNYFEDWDKLNKESIVSSFECIA